MIIREVAWMKLILIMIRDEDKDKVQKELLVEGFTPTFIATTGDFLQFGKSLFLLGIEGKEMERVKTIIFENTKESQIKNGELFRANLYVMGTDKY